MDNGTVYVLRGLPGSGKSTLAQYISSDSKYIMGEVVLCSADQFFIQGGHYFFEASKLGAAHEYCRNKFKDALIDNFPCIIVDNTNTLHKEYKYYKDEAIAIGYRVQVITVGEFTDEAVDRYTLSNTHGVPHDKIKQMRDRFQL